MSTYYSPLRYPGGKNCIFPFVANLFYENQLIGGSYAEPYAGGAGLALRLLFEGYVEHIYINDFDRSIYAFWNTVINRSVDFCEWIEEVEISVLNWDRYKEIQTHPDEVGVFELAKSTFFLNRTNVSGIIKGGIIGGREQKGTYKLDARFNKRDLISRIEKIASLNHRISTSNLDGVAFIKKLDRKKENIFIYLDPPYFQKGAKLYMNYYSEKDHKKLSQQVRRMHKKWMVSYDKHDFILSLYAEQNKVAYFLSQSASNRVGEEIVIFAEGLDFNDSLKMLGSPTLI